PYAKKTISDGATSDDDGRIYLTDPEHSAVVTVEPDRTLRTLVKDPRLRWPDGMSFGPDGWSARRAARCRTFSSAPTARGASTRRIRSGASSQEERRRLGNREALRGKTRGACQPRPTAHGGFPRRQLRRGAGVITVITWRS